MYALLSTLLYRKALLVDSNFGKTIITADGFKMNKLLVDVLAFVTLKYTKKWRKSLSSTFVY